MLPKIVPVQQSLANPFRMGLQRKRPVSHPRHRLQHNRIMGRIMRIFPQQNGA